MDLIEALKSLSVETGSLVCLGCGYEHNCSIHGCAIIRAAVDLLKSQAAEIAPGKEANASCLEYIESLKAQLSASQQRERAAVEDSALRKNTELTPIYTSGGHGGYYDDDDEDFWCPVCHGHLGTHRGFVTTCPRCGQRVNHDSEPLYNYRDMRESEAQWRGPQEAEKGDHNET